MNNNMTALMSCFVRAYHYKNNDYKIYNDVYAEKILSKEEYEKISNSLIKGIDFFYPDFNKEKDSLRFIVDNKLSPSVLARSIFAKRSLLNAIKLGCKQYLVFAAGYDTSIYNLSNKLKNLKTYELDKKEIINDKKDRLLRGKVDISKVNYIECDLTLNNWLLFLNDKGYIKDNISFCSLLGISYYLTIEEFDNLIKNISSVLTEGSAIVFDYPNKINNKDKTKIKELANGCYETMKSNYSYNDIEQVLSKYNFYIYEHLDNKDMTNIFFNNYNILNPNHKINAPLGVEYCLVVKK